MSEPSVLCVMLTADRPEMAARAVRSFHAQTYGNKRLLILDSGDSLPSYGIPFEGHNVIVSKVAKRVYPTIGELRNFGGAWAAASKITPDGTIVRGPADIIAHFDDDDVSHHTRLEEQVALLQASGKDAVGYRDMLFWHEPQAARLGEITRDDGKSYESRHLFTIAGTPGEAWLYSNNDPRYCVGTSLMYWRKTWERRPFQALPRNRESSGEDTEWIREVSRIGVSSISGPLIPQEVALRHESISKPRMIASIHGSNTMKYEMTPHNWRRIPEWDEHCRRTMVL